MTLLVLVPLVALVALLQTSVAPYFSVGGVTFDLVLIGAVVWGIARDPREALVWIALGGGVLDLFGAQPWGSSLLALLPAAMLTLAARVSMVESRVLLTIWVVALATLAAAFVRLAVAASLGDPVDTARVLGVAFLPQMLANAVLASLVLVLVRVLPRREAPSRLAGE